MIMPLVSFHHLEVKGAKYLFLKKYFFFLCKQFLNIKT